MDIPDVEQGTGPRAKESHRASVSWVQVPLEVVVELPRGEAAAAYSSEVEVGVRYPQAQDMSGGAVAEVVHTD